MAYGETWDEIYNNNPAVTNKVKDTPNFIKSVRRAIRERFNKEHNFNLADSLTENQGKHNEGSARVFVQTTAPTDPSVTKETVYVGGETPDFKQGRIYFNPTSKKYFVYVAGSTNAFVEVQVTNADVSASCTGNAATATLAADATKLKTARTIGGVSFDGSADINLPGVNSPGNQDTTGNAATASVASTVTRGVYWYHGESFPAGIYIIIDGLTWAISAGYYPSGGTLPSGKYAIKI